MGYKVYDAIFWGISIFNFNAIFGALAGKDSSISDSIYTWGGAIGLL